MKRVLKRIGIDCKKRKGIAGRRGKVNNKSMKSGEDKHGRRT